MSRKMDWPLLVLIGAVLAAVGTYLYNKQTSSNNKERYENLKQGQDETKETIVAEADRVVSSIKDAIANMDREKPTVIAALRKKFPRGFVVLGQEDGVTSFKPYPADSDSIQVNAVWSEATMEVDKTHGLVTLMLPAITYKEGLSNMTVGKLQMGPMPINMPQPKRLGLIRTPGGALTVVAELLERNVNGDPVFVVGFEVAP